eukprot:2600826-Rhodomonas_salina.1
MSVPHTAQLGRGRLAGGYLLGLQRLQHFVEDADRVCDGVLLRREGSPACPAARWVRLRQPYEHALQNAAL